MSLENIDVIDFVSIDKTGNVVLTVVDDVKWDSENTHLLKLQNKLNAYLDAIENGSLYESYPDAKGRQIVISVNCKHFPNEDGKIFLQRSKKMLEDAGYHFNYSNLIK
jgi:hypothetical protein